MGRPDARPICGWDAQLSLLLLEVLPELESLLELLQLESLLLLLLLLQPESLELLPPDSAVLQLKPLDVMVVEETSAVATVPAPSLDAL